MSGPIGREAELEIGSGFLESLPDGPAALVVGGEAGIGKTTVWAELVRLAHDRGFGVLSCRRVQAEAELSFVGLSDLLADVVDDVAPHLPEPQRRALDVALLRADPGGASPDHRAIGAGTLSALAELSGRAPVVVAVDDVQWLDGPTARALGFAARRLRDHPVGFLLSVRPERVPGPPPLGLADALPGDRVRRVTLGPMSVGALHNILLRGLSRSFPRRLLVRIAEVSEGNPFFALEIARALPSSGPEPGWGEVLPVPETLRELLDARVGDLLPRTRELLLVASAASRPSVELVERVVGGPLADELRAAVQAGILEGEDGRIRFTHPLLASSVYAGTDREARRALHRKLAGAVDELEERARHLALAADGPSAEAAGTLAESAARARTQGAPDAAADRYELAVRLSPASSTDALRWVVDEAACRLEAGEADRAGELLERAVAELGAGAVRAEARRLLATIRARRGAVPQAIELLELAAREAGDDRRVRVETELTSFWILTTAGDVRRGAEHARAAMRALEGSSDRSLLAPALVQAAVAELLSGSPVPEEALARALELEAWAERRPLDWRPSFFHAYVARALDRLDEARERFARVRRDLEERGDEGSLPFLLFLMSETETWAGDFTGARALAGEAVDAATATGQPEMEMAGRMALALADTHLGNLPEARDHAARMLELGRSLEAPPLIHLAATTLGHAELSLGHVGAVVDVLGGLPGLLAEVGLGDPAQFRFLPDLVEALLEVGDLGRAEAVLEPFEALAERLDRRWARAVAARCRALLLAARGESSAALDRLDRAEELHAGLAYPFDHARTLLVRGRIHRRRREKGAAKQALDRAAETFTDLRASAWLERTTREARRVGIRPPAPAAFTPTETRVAELAATGMTNREVASAAFISPKTVEAALARVYRKLGIRSRAELGAVMSARASIDARPGQT
ncbi:MAG: AAA family ATPase [Actinobacteria bacterium]|nr:AAA family ATPase [Actinomycetota bacterium]